jgi:hypothetical protein
MPKEKRRKPELHPEVRKYLKRITSKGGKIGAAVTNAKLTPAERKARAVKASKAAAEALTPAQRKARARKAATARWANSESSKGNK